MAHPLYVLNGSSIMSLEVCCRNVVLYFMAKLIVRSAVTVVCSERDGGSVVRDLVGGGADLNYYC